MNDPAIRWNAASTGARSAVGFATTVPELVVRPTRSVEGSDETNRCAAANSSLPASGENDRSSASTMTTRGTVLAPFAATVGGAASNDGPTAPAMVSGTWRYSTARIGCTRLFSLISKSAAASPGTGRPSASSTVTSTMTSDTPLRNAGG